jgi:hypothetical protein
VIAVLKHKLSGFNLDVIAGETYPTSALPTEFPLQQFVNFLGFATAHRGVAETTRFLPDASWAFVHLVAPR